MRHRFIGFVFNSVKTPEVSDHPIETVQFPVQWRLPGLAMKAFPAFGKPPAKIRIAPVEYEFQILAVADRHPVNRKVLHKDSVIRILIVEGEFITSMPKPESTDFHFRRAADAVARLRSTL